MTLHDIMKLKGVNMISSRYVKSLLLLIRIVGLTFDLETYSQAAELGTEFIINIINKFCVKVLTTILLRYA
ncbi:hypothetical protein CBF85_00060 [Lactobacillus taiwanensis]|nr:hypothetical protein CBF61_08285 [Lactobacillus taiwanensis]OYS29888.1 hypothetical protein CBF75_09155 [Lactobacillus taiwanensis]OYS33373.1 hypothetical protein CBF78_06155 [Lactobacillus taiwanensis]OYS40255.1 hypothetical protein CBF85_00060 [Lactobacillus taiwanensis]